MKLCALAIAETRIGERTIKKIDAMISERRSLRKDDLLKTESEAEYIITINNHPENLNGVLESAMSIYGDRLHTGVAGVGSTDQRGKELHPGPSQSSNATTPPLS